MLKCLNAQKGVVIYLAIVVMSVLLTIGVGLSTILIGQIRVFKRMGDSVVAIYAADTGIERALYEENKGTPIPIGGSLGPVSIDLNGDGPDPTDPTYTVWTVDSTTPPCPAAKCFHSTGIYKGVRRKIEASL